MRDRVAQVASFALALVAVAGCREDSRSPLQPDSIHRDIAQLDPGQKQDPADFVEITAGNYHTCARTAGGDVYCWGMIGGPLYIISKAQADSFPRLVTQGATQISAGFAHTCGLDKSGLAFCWGDSELGQGGPGSSAAAVSTKIYSGPVAPPIGSSAPLQFIAIGAGGYSTCATTSSALFCWGQLGDIKGVPTPAWTSVPNFIGKYNGFNNSLTVGRMHACIELPQFTQSFCWGTNDHRQAGVDPAKAMFYPGTSMLIFAQDNDLGPNVNRISTHEDFTCADITDGTVRCFGQGENGELGSDLLTFEGVSESQLVGGGMLLSGVSVGTHHACALDPKGYAFCWGVNDWGQLGQSPKNLTRSSKPQPVGGGHTFRALAAGTNHTCGIGTDNHIYCWGQTDYRQLGTSIVDLMTGKLISSGLAPEPVLTM